MGRSSFFVAASIIVGIAVIIGVLTVGGPKEGRREKFDLRRYDDLRKISSALVCVNWRISQPTLPDELSLKTMRSYCGGVEIQAETLLDNETGEPYEYIRINENQFSVCANFYDAQKAVSERYWMTQGMSSFNPETGCATGRVS